ncbi:integron integrase, partial [Pseudoxanthomonas sp. SGD-10]
MSYDGELAAITGGVAPRGAPRLLDQVRGRLRLKHYSLRTEQAYLYWIRRYVRVWLPRHPAELDGAAVEA